MGGVLCTVGKQDVLNVWIMYKVVHNSNLSSMQTFISPNGTYNACSDSTDAYKFLNAGSHLIAVKLQFICL